MIALYRFLTRLVYMLLFPYARLRARSGDDLWRGRLALDLPSGPVDIWLHAASVGEVKVLGNLVSFLKAHRPEIRLHVTTMTATGQAMARKVLGDMASVTFFPLDAAPAIDRALDELKPSLIAVAETEIWPNLILGAGRNGTPILLVNGRMSERAFGKYRLIGSTMGSLLERYDRFFLKTERDRERYLGLGVAGEKTEVAGDMKFDAPVGQFSAERRAALREEAGMAHDDFFFLAGSTRRGEVEILLDMFVKLRSRVPRLRLGLAPRHLERLDEVRRLVEEAGLTLAPFGTGDRTAEVTLVDRIGILSDLYGAADLAFVGGTLTEIGGHNILEPVWTQTPVLFGPSLDNVTEAADYICSHDYGARVANAGELAEIIEAVIDGQRQFATLETNDTVGSTTAKVGQYILERLNNA